MHKLPMIFQPQPSACYFMHDMILRQVIMATQPGSKENAFQNVYNEGFSPLSPLSRDHQGLPGGSARLGVSRRIVLSYKDWFVILH
jgi:hypothetical protein